MIVFGIDPGATGGAAVLKDGDLIDAMRMPTVAVRGKPAVDGSVLHDWMYDHLDGGALIVLEHVHAMPRQGVSSSFQFGRMFGAVEALAIATGRRVEHVTPSVWKKAFHLSSDKQGSIDAARLRFGDGLSKYVKFKKDEGVAEACLLAAYGHSHLL